MLCKLPTLDILTLLRYSLLVTLVESFATVKDKKDTSILVNQYHEIFSQYRKTKLIIVRKKNRQVNSIFWKNTV